MSEFTNISFDLPKNQSNVIKVIGVGGGGSNAINHMFQQGIKGVDFVVCNTDAQALQNSPVPNKIQLGLTLTEGLGAGANPEVGQQSAIESMALGLESLQTRPLSEKMSEFLAYIENTWYPLASNTQFVESGVKEAKICATTRRDEMVRSIYTLIRSSVVNKCSEEATAKVKNEKIVLKGNRFLLSGELGKRKRRDEVDVQEEEKTKTNYQPRNAIRNKQIISMATRKLTMVVESENKEEYCDVKLKMTKSTQFSRKRIESKHLKFQENKDKKKRENVR